MRRIVRRKRDPNAIQRKAGTGRGLSRIGLPRPQEMSNEIVVSIICNAYNHAPYIRECLDSLVAQRADFAYEILVHDDASTDGTADIIREYEAKHPDLVKPVYQTENQYFRGGIARFQYPRAKGRFIALCEGDDYWTDPMKLQKQVAALEAHPEIDLCAHAADRIDGTTGAVNARIAPADHDAVFSAEQVIAGGGMFVATSSLLYRASLNDAIPPFRANRRSDYTLQIHGSLRGGMLYLSDNMSVYRHRTPGSWSMGQTDLREQRGFYERVSAMLTQLEADTQGAYHDVISARIERYHARLIAHECDELVRRRDFKALLGSEYVGYYSALPLYKKCGVRLCVRFPGIYDVWERVRDALR